MSPSGDVRPLPSASYETRKRAHVEDLRKQALTASGVGRSLKNLAPILANELRAIVGMQLRAGKLQQQWDAALEAASKSDVEEGERTLAAVAVLLAQFSNEAANRLVVHGDALEAKHAELTGKADATEEMLAELVASEPEVSADTESPPDSLSERDEATA